MAAVHDESLFLPDSFEWRMTVLAMMTDIAPIPLGAGYLPPALLLAQGLL